MKHENFYKEVSTDYVYVYVYIYIFSKIPDVVYTKQSASFVLLSILARLKFDRSLQPVGMLDAAFLARRLNNCRVIK